MLVAACDADNPSSSTNRTKEAEDLKGAVFVIQSNLKILARAISTLSKMSEDVYIELCQEGLIFKVFNRYKSAYCVFRFAPDFFNDCDMALVNLNKVNICRISMKAAQTVFKGVHVNDKNFIACEFRVDPNSDTMNARLLMNYDITRSLKVKLLEMNGDLLQPTHDRSKYRNCTVLFASILTPILNQIKNEAEVTLFADEFSLQIRNYQSDDNQTRFNVTDFRGSKKVRTETKISVDKLNKHQLAFPIEFSFPLREFSAIVSFADQLSSEVSLYYDSAGKPLIVSIEAHSNFDIELQLATSSADDDTDVDGEIFNHQTTALNNSVTQRGPMKEKSIRLDITSSKSSEERPGNDENVEEVQEGDDNPIPNNIPDRNETWRACEVPMHEEEFNEPEGNQETLRPVDVQINEELLNKSEEKQIEDIPQQEEIAEQAQNEPMDCDPLVEGTSRMNEDVSSKSLLDAEKSHYSTSSRPKRGTRRINRRLRRILMGTRSRYNKNGEEDDRRCLAPDSQNEHLTQTMSQCFTGKRFLVADSQLK